MNGNSRLYRSTSSRMLAGVCAGVGAYFNIDANIVRLISLVLTFVTGGAFALVYLVLWLVLPTAASTATDFNGVINENLSDMGTQFRGFTGGFQQSGGPAAPGAPSNAGTQGQPQLSQAGSTAGARASNVPMALILIGVFFLLLHLGIFHAVHWSFWWPVLLIGLGVLMINRRRR